MEVRDGILKHSKGKGHVFSKGGKDKAKTLEGQIVRAADGIAYANHDLDDALRAGVIEERDIPSHIIKAIGNTHSKRIDTMVKSVIYASLERDLREISMGEDILSVTEDLRAFLFKNVYENEITHREFLKAKKILKELYLYYMRHPEEVFSEIPRERLGDDTERLVCDFVAGMTDRYALMMYEKLFLPQPWLVM
jgi:dGTPase